MTRSMSKKRIVGIIGIGHVGAHVAYSLAVQGIADELILVDKDQKKADCECQDIFDSVSWLPPRVGVRVGDFADLRDCDVIANSTGKISLLATGNNNRIEEMDFTVKAVRGYVDKVMASGFHGVVINVTNPCDIITGLFAKLAGLPRGQVFGTGTGLDTARLRSALARQTGIDHKSICAYVLGEHGASQMVPWSAVSFGGRPLSAWAAEDERSRFDHEAMRKEAANGGWVVFSGKQCTEYGICSTAARLAHIVLLDEKQIMPVSAELRGEYGEEGLFVGAPAVVGAGGAERVVELTMSDEDLRSFKSCCADVRKNAEAADKIG